MSDTSAIPTVNPGPFYRLIVRIFGEQNAPRSLCDTAFSLALLAGCVVALAAAVYYAVSAVVWLAGKGLTIMDVATGVATAALVIVGIVGFAGALAFALVSLIATARYSFVAYSALSKSSTKPSLWQTLCRPYAATGAEHYGPFMPWAVQACRKQLEDRKRMKKEIAEPITVMSGTGAVFGLTAIIVFSVYQMMPVPASLAEDFSLTAVYSLLEICVAAFAACLAMGSLWHFIDRRVDAALNEAEKTS